MNLLLDTNVLIDYRGRKEPFFPAAQKVVIAGFFGDVRLWAPAQSFVDAFYVLSRGAVADCHCEDAHGDSACRSDGGRP